MPGKQRLGKIAKKGKIGREAALKGSPRGCVSAYVEKIWNLTESA
ncbi:hypothetical protein SAMN02910358_02282, partial [Lachnospiraceae bacterium XBB1006]